MGYRSDVRLVIKKDAIKIFEELLNKTNDENFINIMGKVEINKTIGNVMYIGWNNLGGNEVNLIEDAVWKLEEQKKSYRLVVIGENVDDIEQLSYEEAEDKYMPYPCLIRMVDDEDMESQLKAYADYTKLKVEMEMNEYE